MNEWGWGMWGFLGVIVVLVLIIFWSLAAWVLNSNSETRPPIGRDENGKEISFVTWSEKYGALRSHGFFVDNLYLIFAGIYAAFALLFLIAMGCH